MGPDGVVESVLLLQLELGVGLAVNPETEISRRMFDDCQRKTNDLLRD